MVVGYHFIWTLYGWWLPNDPRGSMSHSIASDVLRDLGELHFGRKRIQPPSRVIRQFYENAEPRLQFPLLTLSDPDIDLVAEAFGHAIRQHRYTCYACAIMPDHVHILIRKHRDDAPKMIENLQHESKLILMARSPSFAHHPVWGGCGWKVFLDDRADMERTTHYIEQNPLKARRPAQHFPFVQKYAGWLP